MHQDFNQFTYKEHPMRIMCRPVDSSYLESAPYKFVNEVEINASAEEIFSVLEDAEAWPKFFKAISNVTWTSPKPFGVGTTRTVTSQGMKFHEEFVVWEQNKRYAFYFTATSMPFVNALYEDYLLEELANGITKFTYTVACEPKLFIRLLGPIGKNMLGKTFKEGAEGLRSYMHGQR